MSLTILPRCEQAPGHCIVSLKGEDPEGFIDTGLSPAVIDPRIYLSVSVMKEYALKLGFVDGADLEAAERKIKDLEIQVQEMDGELAAIDVLKNHGYRPARSAGRPRKAE